MHYVMLPFINTSLKKYIKFYSQKRSRKMLDNIRNQNVEGRYRETSDKRTNSSLIKVTSLLGLVYEKKIVQ